MKKLLSLLMSIVLAFAALTGFVGCKKSDPNTIEIAAMNLGYGTKWLHALKAAYTKLHPDINIVIDDSYTGGDDNNLTDELDSGVTDYDIFFGRTSMFKFMLKSNCKMEDLTEWYTSPNPYDSQYTVKQKLKSDILESITVEKNGQEKQYTVPWVSCTLGILYNTKLFNDNGLSVPRTTDELLALCEQIKNLPKTNGSYYAFIDSITAAYITNMLQVWFTQYEGVDVSYDFWDGYGADGVRYSTSLFEYEGILEAYKVIFEILCAKNGYIHPNTDLSFTDAQNYILDDSYRVAMMPNGDWILREMEDNYDKDEVHVDFMKTPIISSIINKLSTVNDDEKLKEVVDAIDAGETGLAGVSQEDFDRVKEARNVVTSYTYGHVGYIPSYSEQKSIAKDFLHFMVSDQGLKIFTKATNGSTQPYTYDYLGDAELSNVMNEFSVNAYTKFNSSTILPYEYAKNKLFCFGGVCLDDWQMSFVLPFRAPESDKKLYKDPETFFLEHKAFYDNRWQNCLNSAGLKQGG